MFFTNEVRPESADANPSWSSPLKAFAKSIAQNMYNEYVIMALAIITRKYLFRSYPIISSIIGTEERQKSEKNETPNADKISIKPELELKDTMSELAKM